MCDNLNKVADEIKTCTHFFSNMKLHDDSQECPYTTKVLFFLLEVAILFSSVNVWKRALCPRPRLY